MILCKIVISSVSDWSTIKNNSANVNFFHEKQQDNTNNQRKSINVAENLRNCGPQPLPPTPPTMIRDKNWYYQFAAPPPKLNIEHQNNNSSMNCSSPRNSIASSNHLKSSDKNSNYTTGFQPSSTSYHISQNNNNTRPFNNNNIISSSYNRPRVYTSYSPGQKHIPQVVASINPVGCSSSINQCQRGIKTTCTTHAQRCHILVKHRFTGRL